MYTNQHYQPIYLRPPSFHFTAPVELHRNRPSPIPISEKAIVNSRIPRLPSRRAIAADRYPLSACLSGSRIILRSFHIHISSCPYNRSRPLWTLRQFNHIYRPTTTARGWASTSTVQQRTPHHLPANEATVNRISAPYIHRSDTRQPSDASKDAAERIATVAVNDRTHAHHRLKGGVGTERSVRPTVAEADIHIHISHLGPVERSPLPDTSRHTESLRATI